MTRRLAALLLVFALSTGLLPRSAHAISRFYFDMAGGLSWIKGPNTFFSSEVPSNIGIGTLFLLGFGANVFPMPSPFYIQFGYQARMSNGSQGTMSYSIIGNYLTVRFELQRYFLTTGASLFTLKRNLPGSGLTGYSKASGAIGIMVEAGYIWPITPAVDIMAAAGGQIYTTGGVMGPRPIYDLAMLMRSYIGAPRSFGKTRSYYGQDGDFDGWRYPYGWPKK